MLPANQHPHPAPGRPGRNPPRPPSAQPYGRARPGRARSGLLREVSIAETPAAIRLRCPSATSSSAAPLLRFQIQIQTRFMQIRIQVLICTAAPRAPVPAHSASSSIRRTSRLPGAGPRRSRRSSRRRSGKCSRHRSRHSSRRRSGERSRHRRRLRSRLRSRHRGRRRSRGCRETRWLSG